MSRRLDLVGTAAAFQIGGDLLCERLGLAGRRNEATRSRIELEAPKGELTLLSRGKVTLLGTNDESVVLCKDTDHAFLCSFLNCFSWW